MSITRLLRNTERILTVIDIIQVSASMINSGGSHITTCERTFQTLYLFGQPTKNQ